MVEYRFDTGISIKVLADETASAEALVAPFISWLNAKLADFPGHH